jgi:hypothetical protein
VSKSCTKYGWRCTDRRQQRGDGIRWVLLVERILGNCSRNNIRSDNSRSHSDHYSVRDQTKWRCIPASHVCWLGHDLDGIVNPVQWHLRPGILFVETIVVRFMRVKEVEATLFDCLIGPAVSYSSTPSPTSANKASSVTPAVNDPLPTSRASTSATTSQLSLEPTTADASSGSSNSPGSSGAGLSVGDKAAVASAIIGGIALILAYFTMPRRYRDCLCCCFGGSSVSNELS